MDIFIVYAFYVYAFLFARKVTAFLRYTQPITQNGCSVSIKSTFIPHIFYAE